MYNEKVINSRLERLEARRGAPLVRYSVKDARQAVGHFKLLMDDHGNRRRALTQEENAFIENERILCALDFRYYLERYSTINDRENRLVQLNPNVAQTYLLALWAESEGNSFEIANQILKARQLGLSTLWELAIGHRLQFKRNLRAVVGSNDPDKSRTMSAMMELNWEHMPWYLMPERTAYRVGERIEFGKMGSLVSIQHGTQTSGIGRGSTYTLAHLSELADYVNPEELVDSALLKAIHPSPRVLLGLESTAKGVGNWWHKTWEVGKKGWEKGLARLRPVFLPWYVGVDLYPMDAWMRQRAHIFETWIPSELTLNHARRAENYVHSEPVLASFLGERWTMPREQMFWWEFTREEHVIKDELSQFLSECPADDIEAFQSTGTSVIPGNLIAEMREVCQEPWGIFGLQEASGLVSSRHQPSHNEVNPDAKPIYVNAQWSPLTNLASFTLLPLKWRGLSTFDPFGKLVVWEPPLDGFSYGIGVDTGDGIGADRTVIQVIRKGNSEYNDAQVAEYASPFLSALDAWPIILAIATWYSTYDREGKTRKQSKIVIECAANGAAAQHELRKRGWWNFHRFIRFDKNRIKSTETSKLGWYTVPWSRAQMLDHLITYVKEGWVDIDSPWLLEELGTFQRDPRSAKIEAIHGAHDDRIFALGIALFSLHDQESRGVEPVWAQERLRREEEAEAYLTYPGHPGERELGINSPLHNYIYETGEIEY